MNKTSHREIAIQFLKFAATGKVREAYDKFVSSNFRHHNAYFPGDRESLMKGMEQSAAENPDTRLEVKMVLEDGNMIATYSHVKHKPQDLGFAVVHIFRFEGDRIAEMWDIGIAIPEDSPNENGMF